MLRDEDVGAERRDPPIVRELLPAVVGFRRIREHLDDDGGVRDRRVVVRMPRERTADDGYVGIGRETGLEHGNAEIGREDLARSAVEALAELANDVRR